MVVAHTGAVNRGLALASEKPDCTRISNKLKYIFDILLAVWNFNTQCFVTSTLLTHLVIVSPGINMHTQGFKNPLTLWSPPVFWVNGCDYKFHGSYREKSSEFFSGVLFPGKVSKQFFHLIFLEPHENVSPYFSPPSSEQYGIAQELMQKKSLRS